MKCVIKYANNIIETDGKEMIALVITMDKEMIQRIHDLRVASFYTDYSYECLKIVEEILAEAERGFDENILGN
jgi:hypothetical protein